LLLDYVVLFKSIVSCVLYAVDKREVPDYYDFIKKPMDFGRIKKKLEVTFLNYCISVILIRGSVTMTTKRSTYIRWPRVPFFSGQSHFLQCLSRKIFWHQTDAVLSRFWRLVPFLTRFPDFEEQLLNVTHRWSSKCNKIVSWISKIYLGWHTRNLAFRRRWPPVEPTAFTTYSTASLQSSGVVSFLAIRNVVTLYRHVCVTTNYTDTTSDHEHNSKQHAVVSIHLNTVTCPTYIKSYESMLLHRL